MNLRQLRYFVRIVECGSFGRAAVDLRVAQPALTYHIRQLEQEAGVLLLHRNARGITLTQAGQLLLRRAHVILHEVDDSLAELQALAAIRTGQVSLGLPPSAACVLLPRLVEVFCEACPDIQLSVREGYTGYIYQWLTERTVDLAICSGTHPNYAGLPLYRDRMCLIGAGPQPSHDGGRIAVRQLGDMQLVMATKSHFARQSIEGALRQAGRQLSIKAEVDSPDALKQLLLSGFGFSVMPRVMCRRELDDGRLWALDLYAPEMVREFLLIHPNDPAPAVRELQRILIDEIRRAQTLGYWDPPTGGFR